MTISFKGQTKYQNSKNIKHVKTFENKFKFIHQTNVQMENFIRNNLIKDLRDPLYRRQLARD